MGALAAEARAEVRLVQVEAADALLHARLCAGLGEGAAAVVVVGGAGGEEFEELADICLLVLHLEVGRHTWKFQRLYDLTLTVTL